MPRFSLDEVAAVTGAEIRGRGLKKDFTHIFYDTRKIHDTDGLFIALQTDTGDGHDFVGRAYERGVRLFLVRTPMDHDWPDALFLVVRDPLTALQCWAASHRQKLPYPFVGITGSNGKTIVKEWLFTLLKDSCCVYRSPKSFNSQLGVALAILGADESHELALIEAGISQPGEMHRLETMIRPTLGILTNVGEAHAKNFESKTQQRLEKLQLFENVERLILPAADKALCALAEQAVPRATLCFWGEAPTSRFRLLKRTIHGGETVLELLEGDTRRVVVIPFIGEAHVYNYLVAYAAARTLGVEHELIEARSRRLTPVDLRLELVSGMNETVLINDAYNADLQSLKIALDYLKQQHKRRFSVILSDILESGKPDAVLYQAVADLLVKYALSKVVCVGEKIGAHRACFAGLHSFFYQTTTDLLQALAVLDFRDEAILIKGARVFRFERVSRWLQDKIHETSLEINLSALAENLKYFKKGLRPGTKIAAMVKAFSYGSGSFEIAGLLQQQRVDYLVVAYVDEGIALRQQGIHLPLMVLNPDPRSYDACRRYGLEPELYSLSGLRCFLAEMRGCDHAPGVHLELNTGMNRLGFDQADLPALIETLKAAPTLRVASVFSHLAASDRADERDFTLAQIDRFKQMSHTLEQALEATFLKHVLNSSGILNYPDAQFDMVRLGIGMYGFVVDARIRQQLCMVATLKSTISQIHCVEAGASVGYGRRFKALRPSRIATIPIGYADGLDRRLGNGVGYFLIAGSRAQIVGDICMDMTMVEVTGIDCEAGDEVIIMGEDPSLMALAETLGTIPYEVLTSFAPRIKRRYFYE